MKRWEELELEKGVRGERTLQGFDARLYWDVARDNKTGLHNWSLWVTVVLVLQLWSVSPTVVIIISGFQRLRDSLFFSTFSFFSNSGRVERLGPDLVPIIGASLFCFI